MPDAALHRLRRRSVGTHLSATASSSRPRADLGHGDPATTLRHYAYATPLDDQDLADDMDDLLNRATGIVPT